MKSQYYNPGDLDLTAALQTMGVGYAECQPVTLVYDKLHPRSGGGRAGAHLAMSSNTDVPTEALANAYKDAEADKLLDEAIERLPIPDDQKRELLELAQMSAMSYIAHAFQNRAALERDIPKATPVVEIARGGRFAMVPAEGRSDSLNRKLLAKFG